jgi:hypothetical protein
VKVKLSNKEIRDALNIESSEFPRYVTQIINLANQNAQGDLIQQFTGKSLPEWEKWYVKEKPDAIRMATDKVLDMVENLKDAMDKIDKEMINRWIRDLVIVKTFLGMKFQEAILKKGAELKGVQYRLANPSEESKGVDGFIGKTPISIKPHTYRVKKSLSENISAKIVYYEKLKDGIEVDYGELMGHS